MCLHLNGKQNSPKVATKDITCYKFLKRRLNIHEYYYTTYYQLSPVEIGNTYESKIIVEKSVIGEHIINIALHSFKYLSNLRKTIRRYGYYTDKIVIVKCIIPKGSTYYLGDFEGEGLSYASDKLTYVKILEIIE
jgi:hypothetical protein